MQKVLSSKLCAVPLGLLYVNSAMRHTAKSNLLNKIKISDFMAILLSLDYSKFERFSNIADKISIKLISTFFECEVLAVVPDRYSFKKLLKEYTGQKTQLTYRKFELLITANFQIQSYPGNSNKKTNLVRHLFQK